MTERRWRPDKAYFEQSDRAAALRNLCLTAIAAAEARTLGRADEEVVGAILDVNTGLLALGIRPDMHALDSDDPLIEEKRLALMTDPVVTAEWVAGQVCSVVGDVATSEVMSAADFGEHDELPSGSPLGLIEVQAMSPHLREFAVNYTALGALAGFVDYAAGPSELAVTQA